MAYMVGANLTNAPADFNDGRSAGLGDFYTDNAGNQYVFVQASGSVAQYDAVHIGSTYVAQALTSTLAAAGMPVGVAMATMTSASYGWACVGGLTTVNVLATCSSSTALYTSATAGKLDDTTTSQVKIAGVVILANNATTATAAAAAFLNSRPYAAI